MKRTIFLLAVILTGCVESNYVNPCTVEDARLKTDRIDSLCMEARFVKSRWTLARSNSTDDIRSKLDDKARTKLDSIATLIHVEYESIIMRSIDR